jgi:hypothetical protein
MYTSKLDQILDKDMLPDNLQEGKEDAYLENNNPFEVEELQDINLKHIDINKVEEQAQNKEEGTI